LKIGTVYEAITGKVTLYLKGFIMTIFRVYKPIKKGEKQ